MLYFCLVKQRNCCSSVWHGSKKQKTVQFQFRVCKNTKCSVTDVYGMSFVINTGIWLVSLDCLNTLVIDKICNRKCGIRRPGQDRLHVVVEHVKNDMSHHHKNPCEIHAYRPTSWLTRLLTSLIFYVTFLYSFRAILSNLWLSINKTLSVLTFFAYIGNLKHASGAKMVGLNVVTLIQKVQNWPKVSIEAFGFNTE